MANAGDCSLKMQEVPKRTKQAQLVDLGCTQRHTPTLQWYLAGINLHLCPKTMEDLTIWSAQFQGEFQRQVAGSQCRCSGSENSYLVTWGFHQCVQNKTKIQFVEFEKKEAEGGIMFFSFHTQSAKKCTTCSSVGCSFCDFHSFAQVWT